MRQLLVVVALALVAVSAAGAQGAEQRAGLVVQYGDGRIETACVRFSEPEISGLELLDRSGIPIVVQSGGGGAAVCKIGPDGCDYPAEGCFCERDGARSIYWAFYTLAGDAWAYANLSTSSVPVRDGTVHGWAWGLGESGTGAQPPVLGIDAVCAPADQVVVPAPTAPPAPTAAPTVPPAPTAAPSATLAPADAATAEPSAAPTEASSSTTAEASATTAPSATIAPTATIVPTATTAPPATPPPSATVAPAPAPDGSGAIASYIGFGALALVLIAGAVLAARRR